MTAHLILCLCILSAFGGFVFGVSFCSDTYRDRLVEAELGEYQTDPATGDTSFVIFAEEPTK